MWLLLIGNLERPLDLVDGVFGVFDGPTKFFVALKGSPAVGGGSAVRGGPTVGGGTIDGPAVGCVAVGGSPVVRGSPADGPTNCDSL